MASEYLHGLTTAKANALSNDIALVAEDILVNFLILEVHIVSKVNN